MAETTRSVICIRCLWEGELPLDKPCPNCGPEDCLEIREVYPWYDKVSIEELLDDSEPV